MTSISSFIKKRWYALPINRKFGLFFGILFLLFLFQTVLAWEGQRQIRRADEKILAISDTQLIIWELKSSWEESVRLRNNFILHAMNTDEETAYALHALPIAEKISTLIRNGVILSKTAIPLETPPGHFYERTQEIIQDYQAIIHVYILNIESFIERIYTLTSRHDGLRAELIALDNEILQQSSSFLRDESYFVLKDILATRNAYMFSSILGETYSDENISIEQLLSFLSRVFKLSGRGEEDDDYIRQYEQLQDKIILKIAGAKELLSILTSQDHLILSSFVELLALMKLQSDDSHAKILTIQTLVERIWLAELLISIFLFLVAAMVLHRSITRKIILVNSVAGEMKNGNLESRIQISNSDEIGQLALTLNLMTGQLSETINTLDTLSVAGYKLMEKLDIENIIDNALSAMLAISHAGFSRFAVIENRKILKTFYRYPESEDGGTPSELEKSEYLQEWDTGRSVILRKEGGLTAVDVPLMNRSSLWGVLTGYSYGENSINEKEKESLKFLSALVNTSRENTVLYKTAELQARFDSLTGLLNRRGFLMQGIDFLHRIFRQGLDAALLFIDIDNFKKFNDDYDYETGDRVLSMVAGIISSTLRKGMDLCGRFGGEEFMVLLTELDSSTACVIAERLRKSIEESEMNSDHGKLSVTVSIGVVSLDGQKSPTTGENMPAEDVLNRLIKQGGDLLHAAKKEGRNRVSSGIRNND